MGLIEGAKVKNLSVLVALLGANIKGKPVKDAGFRLLIVQAEPGANGDKVVGSTAIDFLKGEAPAVVNKWKPVNVAWDAAKGKLVGTNGVLDRYACVGTAGANNKLVVVARITGGFLLADGTGRKINAVSEKDAVAISKMIGIANGKVVSKDGKEFISAISGEYPSLNISLNATKAADTKKAATGAKEAENKNQKYSEAFYRVVADQFGKPKARLVKYLIEDRQFSDVEGFAALIQLTGDSKGITIAGMELLSEDCINNKPADEKLVKSLESFVEPAGLAKAVEFFKRGKKDYLTVWDACNYVYLDDKYDLNADTIADQIKACATKG